MIQARAADAPLSDKPAARRMDCATIRQTIGSISRETALSMARQMGYTEEQIAYARKCLAK